MDPQEMRCYVLPSKKPVASRITYRRGAGGAALLSQRHRLFDEAEEGSRHTHLPLRFSLHSDAIRSLPADSAEQTRGYTIPYGLRTDSLAQTRMHLHDTTFDESSQPREV